MQSEPPLTPLTLLERGPQAGTGRSTRSAAGTRPPDKAVGTGKVAGNQVATEGRHRLEHGFRSLTGSLAASMLWSTQTDEIGREPGPGRPNRQRGKSTLMNLLLRFYQPQQGNILLDGTNLQELHLADLRRQIALVTQFERLIAE